MSTSHKDEQGAGLSRKVILTAAVTSAVTAVVSTAIAVNFAFIVSSVYVQSVVRWLTSDSNGLVVGAIAIILAFSWRLRRSKDDLTRLNGWVLLLAAGVGMVMQWKDDVWTLVPKNVVEAVSTGHLELIEIPPVLVEEPFFMWFGIALVAIFVLFSIVVTIAMLSAAVAWISDWVSGRLDECTATSTDANNEIIQSPPPQLDQPTLFDDLLVGSSEDSLATPKTPG